MERIARHTDKALPEGAQWLCELKIATPDGKTVQVAGRENLGEYEALAAGNWHPSTTDNVSYVCLNRNSEGEFVGGTVLGAMLLEKLLETAEAKGWNITGVLPRI